MHAHIRWWQHLTQHELAALERDRLVAILPLAAIEQHGAHLPLSTDIDINLGLLAAAFAELPAECPALALPPVTVGDSIEHSHFTGTLSLTPATLIASIREIGAHLARVGIRRLILFNSHGGNTEAAGIAALALRDEADLLVIRADYFRFPLPAAIDLPDDEIRLGIHGGALETSLMLYLHPERVRREWIRTGERPAKRHIGATARAPIAWRAEDLARDGTIGAPSLASADIGTALVRHFATALAEVITATVEHPLPSAPPE